MKRKEIIHFCFKLIIKKKKYGKRTIILFEEQHPKTLDH